MSDPGLGLGVIARAHIDDVVELRIAQEARAGKGAEERHFGRGGNRLGGDRGRRADRTDQREDLVFLDQLAGGGDGFRRLVAVIDADQPDLAAVHAALAIGFVERRTRGRLSCQGRAPTPDLAAPPPGRTELYPSYAILGARIPSHGRKRKAGGQHLRISHKRIGWRFLQPTAHTRP